MNASRPVGSLSLDLDNLWAYQRVHGDSGWESFASYFDLAVPRILEFLRNQNLTITFFIVGQDAALEKNREALAAIAAAGHEIGNHSFHHQPWFDQRSEQEISDELARAEERIERATDSRARGFRGPGFSLSPALLRVLICRGYAYDASTFPTWIGPLARAYYFRTAHLSSAQRAERRSLYGGWRDALLPLAPYRWQCEAGELLEIPVSTMPVTRLPVHMTYLFQLAAASPQLALAYFRQGMNLCRMTRTAPSLLLHALDFLGGEDVPQLSFFPGMQLEREAKLALLAGVMQVVQRDFDLLTLREMSTRIAAAGKVQVRQLS